jgi:hypothetical protein
VRRGSGGPSKRRLSDRLRAGKPLRPGLRAARGNTYRSVLEGHDLSMYRNGYLYEELLTCILGNWRNIVHSGAHLVVQEVVKRESLGAIPCDPDEHKLNLYIGGNLQAINEFIKRAFELAAF